MKLFLRGPLATPILAPDDTRKVPDLGFWGYQVSWRTTAPPSVAAETAAPSLTLSWSAPILFGVTQPATAGSFVHRSNRASRYRIQPLPEPQGQYRSRCPVLDRAHSGGPT